MDASSEAAEERVLAVEGLLGRLELLPGPSGELARTAVAALSALYGETLARLVDAADDGLVARWAADPLAGHLLALHGLHPTPLAERVEAALRELERRLGSGYGAELRNLDDGVAEVAVYADGRAGSSAVELASAVRDVVLAAAPELVEVRASPAAFIPLAALGRRHLA